MLVPYGPPRVKLTRLFLRLVPDDAHDGEMTRRTFCHKPHDSSLDNFSPGETFVLVGHADPPGRAAHRLRQRTACEFGRVVVLG